MTAAERQRKWRQRNAAQARAATRRWKSMRPGYLGPKRQAAVDKVAFIKEHTPCFDCLGHFPPCCMDFDHVRGKKVAGVSELLARSAPWSSVEAEMAKCELVCANCHRVRTRDRYALENDDGHKGQKEGAR